MPFSVEQFFDVFETYNRATEPAAVILAVIAAMAALALIWRTAWSSRFVLIVLAGLWVWSGGIYHLTFFSRVNLAAWIFGFAFILEGLMLLWLALKQGDDDVLQTTPTAAMTVGVLIAYAVFVYPVLSSSGAHIYPRAPSFGAPCPVTIFTLAALVLIRVPRYAVIIPLVWVLIGISAAAFFGIYSDLALGVAAIAYVLFSTGRRRSFR